MIKIGNLDIDKFYLGDKSDAKIYLGDVKVWPEEEAPETYPYAFQRVSRGGSAYTVPCDSTSSNTITSGDTTSGLSTAQISGATQTETPVSVVFGDCCQTIGDSACSGWTYLSSVTISDNVTTLGNYTFYKTGVSASTKPDLDLSANVGLNVGTNAFDSSYLNNVILPKNCRIQTRSFQSCSASTLSFGSGTQILDGDDINNAFGSCNISNIDLNGVTQIGKYAFYNAKGFTSITVPSSVTTFNTYAFNKASSLNSVTIDYASNATIGAAQFEESSVTSLTIRSHPTSIGNSMFYGCTGLTSLVIPSNISSIIDYAFYGCSGLTSITVESTTPPTLRRYVFDNTNNCPIYVPSGSVDTYKTATNWSAYASRIQAIPQGDAV